MTSPTTVSAWSATRVHPRSPTDSNIGSALTTSSSISAVLSTLTPVMLYALGWLALFLLLRRVFSRAYSPRSVLSTLRPQQRSPELPKGLFNWFMTFWKISDIHVLNTQSLDGFLFLRLLKISVASCLVGCLITWPILIPINVTGAGGLTQLNVLTFANAAGATDPKSYYRYYAHVGCAYIFFGFILYMITRESLFYINLRQAYLISPLYADRISSRTVMFTSVPEEYLREDRLREFLGADKVVNVWIPKDTKSLEEKVKERDKVAMKLEGAETKLIKLVNGARLKRLKKSGAVHTDLDPYENDTEPGSVAARWIKPSQRPTHRLKPRIGKKVDTINWCRTELAKLIPEVEQMQEAKRAGEGKAISTVFVEFIDLREAQAAFQSLTHHQPLHMAPRFTGVLPQDIIWENLRIKWYERIMRIILTTSAVVALVIFWSIPVAFIGSISNINYLVSKIHFLHFIEDVPQQILGVITGLLPTILLAVLMSLLPIFLRLMASIGGDPTLSMVEYTVQNTYFAFQVVQVFLVTTLSSGAVAAAGEIAKDPASIISLLANSLPKASNFYLCYFILQGLAVVSQTLVSIFGLVVFIVLGRLLDSTPRKLYNRWVNLSQQGLGTVYPIYTNLFVIAICYSCIAPLVLGFAAIGLYLFYIAYRYEFLYVYNAEQDTKGLMYPRALQQLFVGLYLAQLCMIGLFAINVGSSRAVLGPLVLMIVFLIFTTLFHISLGVAVSPLLKYLPKTLETEEKRLLALEDEYIGKTIAADDPEAGTNVVRYDTQLSFAEKPSTTLPPPHKQPNMIAKWLRPQVYNDYHTMRRLVPRTFATIEYDPSAARDAYQHPSIIAQVPVLWIPRDVAGVSRQEVRDTSKVIPISDEGASLNEKNKIVWDSENANKVPIYEEPVYY